MPYASKEKRDANSKDWKRRNPEKVKLYQARSYARHSERGKERSRAWRQKHPNGHADGHLKRRYGLSPDDLAAMLKAQNGRCAICGQPPRGGGWKGRLGRLHVDHDHVTGKVRALLCHNCNCGIGWFHEDPKKLQAAIEYLRKHAGTT